MLRGAMRYRRIEGGLQGLHALTTPQERRMRIIQLLSAKIAGELRGGRAFQAAFARGVAVERPMFDWLASIGADVPVRAHARADPRNNVWAQSCQSCDLLRRACARSSLPGPKPLRRVPIDDA